MKILFESTQNNGKKAVYEVVKNGEVLDVFDNEREAVDHAKRNGADAVTIAYHIDNAEGTLDSVEEGDTVWTKDNVNEDWTTFKYKSGANPYIAKTEDEVKKIMTKYQGRITDLGSNFYEIDDSDADADKFSVTETLYESVDDDERIKALADYLEIDPEEISNIYDYEYETPDGDYLVVTEGEAWDLARQDIISIFDDMGLDAFSDHFKDWIINNALETYAFRGVVEESMQSYIDDIANEGDNMYDSRLIAEMIEAGCIDDEDIEDEDFDVGDHTDDFLEYLVDNAGDPVEHCIFNFGADWVTQFACDYDLFDMELIVEECIDLDGVAHFIARYDGDEIELENGLYAYRTN